MFSFESKFKKLTLNNLIIFLNYKYNAKMQEPRKLPKTKLDDFFLEKTG